MKIVLNGLPAVYPISGVGRYTIELGKALENLLGHGKVFWFERNLSDNKYDDVDTEDSTQIQQIQYSLRKLLRKLPGWTMPIRLWRNHQFRAYVRKIIPSVYHETNYTPFDFEEGPTLITVYDLSFVRHPEWHPKDRVKHFEKFCIKKLPRADAIITISEFSKKEIIELLGIDPGKIHVTPLGVARTFTPGRKRTNSLPTEYILFVGNLEPRKNLVMLLHAYRSLPQKLRERFPLVIAGASGWHNKELKEVLQSFPRNEKPILTGYVPQKNLPDLYRGATLFVYPSLYEGFGLPVLEAMASGVPVIASNSTSLPEVTGDAGVLVNPWDMNHLKEAMMRFLEDEKKRQEMAERGIARAKLFSWDKCGRQTLSVYEKILGKSE